VNIITIVWVALAIAFIFFSLLLTWALWITIKDIDRNNSDMPEDKKVIQSKSPQLKDIMEGESTTAYYITKK
jgi:hypothetical protein